MTFRGETCCQDGETVAAAWLFLPDQSPTGGRVSRAMLMVSRAVKEMYLEPFAPSLRAAA